MRTFEIALSSDHGEDLQLMDEVITDLYPHQIKIRFSSPLDLLLHETISWFEVRKPPVAIIAGYRAAFQDLKIIADLKKRPAYQWVPVFLLVDEDLTYIRNRFLSFGVTDVVTWPHTVADLDDQLAMWLNSVQRNLLAERRRERRTAEPDSW